MSKLIFQNLIVFYQKFISPFLGRTCRFYPSCSQYFVLAIQKYGVLKGIFLTFKRVLKCHPGNKGGIDFP